MEHQFTDPRFLPKHIPPSNTEQVINSFSGEYGFLSNFHPCSIRLFNLHFTSSEQAFHYHKLLHPEDKSYLMTLDTAWAAKKFSRKCEIIPEWDEVRTGVMLTVLMAKFGQNLDLQLKLAETRPKLLIEGNKWNDTYWGCVWKGGKDGWVGENHLGRLLMIVRDML